MRILDLILDAEKELNMQDKKVMKESLQPVRLENSRTVESINIMDAKKEN
jgi:hypothetical protein